MRNYVSTNSTNDPSTYVGTKGELTVDPVTAQLRVHDGSTPGGLSISAGGASDRLVNGSYETVLGSDGTLTLPQGTTISDATDIVTVTLDQLTDAGYPGTQVFNKVSDTRYEVSTTGPYMELVGGIWRLKLSTATYYDSTDLITWGTVAGGLPTPVGTLDTLATMNLGVGTNTWAFGETGTLTLPQGTILSEAANSTTITPPNALAGQGLVVRLTGVQGIISDHPGGFTDGDTVTLTVTPDYGSAPVTGTLDYTFTGATSIQLGRALTGTLTFTNETARPISWTIPVSSTMTTFTVTIGNASGFVITSVDNTLTLSTTGSSEDHHIHLIAGDPSITDIYLGDDDQYVKIEKNGGAVVVGTNTNTNHWTFDTTGNITLPNTNKIAMQLDTAQVGQFYRFLLDSTGSSAPWNNVATVVLNKPLGFTPATWPSLGLADGGLYVNISSVVDNSDGTITVSLTSTASGTAYPLLLASSDYSPVIADGGTEIVTAAGSWLFRNDGVLSTGNVSIHGSMIPTLDNTFDLGSPTNEFRHIYTANGSIYLGNVKLSNDGGVLAVYSVDNRGENTETNTAVALKTDRLVNGSNEAVLGSDGNLTVPGTITFSDGTVQRTAYDYAPMNLVNLDGGFATTQFDISQVYVDCGGSKKRGVLAEDTFDGDTSGATTTVFTKTLNGGGA